MKNASAKKAPSYLMDFNLKPFQYIVATVTQPRSELHIIGKVQSDFKEYIHNNTASEKLCSNTT